MSTLMRRVCKLAVPALSAILAPVMGFGQTPLVTETKLGGSLVLREMRMKCGDAVEAVPRYVELEACGTTKKFPVSRFRVAGATRVGDSVFVLAFGDYSVFVAEVCRDGSLDFICAVPDLSTARLFSARAQKGSLVFEVEGTDLLSGKKTSASCEVNSVPVFGGCQPLCFDQAMSEPPPASSPLPAPSHSGVESAPQGSHQPAAKDATDHPPQSPTPTGVGTAEPPGGDR